MFYFGRSYKVRNDNCRYRMHSYDRFCVAKIDKFMNTHYKSNNGRRNSRFSIINSHCNSMSGSSNSSSISSSSGSSNNGQTCILCIVQCDQRQYECIESMNNVHICINNCHSNNNDIRHSGSNIY